MITHRRTKILTYNPNFDFGAVYTNTVMPEILRFYPIPLFIFLYSPFHYEKKDLKMSFQNATSFTKKD